MRCRLVLASSLSLVIVATFGSAASGASKSIKVTFVGDSVPASIEYVPSAQRILEKGLAVRLDLKVCRRLVQRGCIYMGSTPSTALEAVQSYSRSLGEVLVVNVGYNESENGYSAGIDRVMRAALAQGAKGVVWVTLREQNDIYRGTNIVIRRAAKRWPQMQVADWQDYSAGKPWFRDDGLHMKPTGANVFAAFVRSHIFRATA